MPFIGSFRSASGVVDGGERTLNVGAGVCCLTVVGDGGGPFEREKKYFEFFCFFKSTNSLEQV
jgi:hypothetical protein